VVVSGTLSEITRAVLGRRSGRLRVPPEPADAVMAALRHVGGVMVPASPGQPDVLTVQVPVLSFEREAAPFRGVSGADRGWSPMTATVSGLEHGELSRPGRRPGWTVVARQDAVPVVLGLLAAAVLLRARRSG
jgi:hypothetical protein